MLKVREVTASSGSSPMEGNDYVDDFVLCGRGGKTGRSYEGNKRKAETAVQLIEEGKAKRMYAM